MCLFFFRARGIADRLHALDIGIRDIRQILNPLRAFRHALNRREVQAERPRRPEKVRTIIRRQEVAWPDLHYHTVTGALVLSPSPPRIAPSQLRLVDGG